MVDTAQLSGLPIRPTAIGKKNWLFVCETDAGDCGAILYTLIESCRRRGLNPYAHLSEALDNLTVHQANQLTSAEWNTSLKTVPQTTPS